jgi:cytochrome c oxidase, subunit II
MYSGNVKRTLVGGFVAILLLGGDDAGTDFALNMPQGVTKISRDVYDLHMLTLWICVGIGVVVFATMFYSIYRHRKSKGAVAAQFHESTVVEMLWTIVPFLILVIMAIPATTTLIAMKDTSQADLSIKVTGYQWKWHYDYLDDDISFFSTLSTPRTEIENKKAKGEHYLLEVDNPLIVPINKKIRFLLTANDVIHAWWVPVLGWKLDAIPGFITEAWARIEKPGTYRGQCAELCGKDHGFMPIVVIAKTEEEYDQWVAQQKAAKATDLASEEWDIEQLMSRGETVYNSNCAACHQSNGEGIPEMVPAIKGSAVATGSAEMHLNIVLNGKPGTRMPPFASQLSDADIAAVTTYQRNAFGNDTGDAIQPSDVNLARPR